MICVRKCFLYQKHIICHLFLFKVDSYVHLLYTFHFDIRLVFSRFFDIRGNLGNVSSDSLTEEIRLF